MEQSLLGWRRLGECCRGVVGGVGVGVDDVGALAPSCSGAGDRALEDPAWRAAAAAGVAGVAGIDGAFAGAGAGVGADVGVGASTNVVGVGAGAGAGVGAGA